LPWNGEVILKRVYLAGRPAFDLGEMRIQSSELLPSILDINVHDSCKEAATELILLWRSVIKFKSNTTSFLDGSALGSLLDNSLAVSIMTKIDSFENAFRPFIRQCLQNFQRLSARPRIFLGM
jgi:hypothetical protein